MLMHSFNTYQIIKLQYQMGHMVLNISGAVESETVPMLKETALPPGF